MEKDGMVFLEEDMKIFEDISKKYCISIQEMGRILARKKTQYPRYQILYSEKELEYVDHQRNKNGLKLSRSEYCIYCYKKAIENNIFSNINIVDILKNTDGETRSPISISFSTGVDFVEMKKKAKELQIKFGTLLRYCSLNVDL